MKASPKSNGSCWVCRTIENTKSIILAFFAGQGVLKKDLTVLVDGAKPPPKSTSKFFMLNEDFGKLIIWQT